MTKLNAAMLALGCASRRNPQVGRSALTCVRAAAFAIGVLVTGGCVLFAAGCGGSPTGPDGRGSHIRLTVMDRVGRPLAGALVTVLDGPLAGSTTLTDGAGRIALKGTAAGTVTLRASRDGFQTRTQALSWETTTRTTKPTFRSWLDTLEPPIGLDPGDYTLTLAIDLATASNWIPRAPCAGFPVEFASRSYRAAIAEASPIYFYNRVVSADDPTLRYHGLFGFGVAGRVVGFEWDDSLTEEFPGFRYLNIGGAAPTTGGLAPS